MDDVSDENNINPGDFVRFINGNFIIGVVTKVSDNGYATVIDETGGTIMHRKEILIKIDGFTMCQEVKVLLIGIKTLKSCEKDE